MSWFTDMAAAAPAGAISAPPGSSSLGAATGLTGGAGSLAALGGGQAGPNGPGGAMAWMQNSSAQPVLGHAIMGGTQILNTGSDWTAGSPMPPGRFMPSPSFQDGPQPVPGQPPRQLDQPNPNDQYTGIDWDRHLVGSRPGEPGFDPNKGFNQILYPGGQLPPGWQPNTGGINPNDPGNRGSGQPINQPMGIQIGDNPNQPINMGMSPSQPTSFPTGSLQGLGGGQLNQSGMVTLRGTDGTTKAVPQQDLAHWLSKGAVRV